MLAQASGVTSELSAANGTPGRKRTTVLQTRAGERIKVMNEPLVAFR